MDCMRVILAFIFPPLAVLLKDGIGLHFLFSILLTALFYFPGLIHALWRLTQHENPQLS